MKPEFAIKLKEQFKAEAAAYQGYKTLRDIAEDEYIKEALDEIMYDEFLHAKFLRSYLIKNNLYVVNQNDELEKIYQIMMMD